jgi:hypothetical protein
VWLQVGCSAAFTFAGVKGTERRRTPVAAKTALLIVAGNEHGCYII